MEVFLSMARVYREVRQTTIGDPDIAAPTAVRSGTNLVARIVSLLGGIIVALLALRFILSLLGANPGNTFANLIYNLSYPFVAPFFGLFSYRGELGVGRFDYETLIAMAFWSFATWAIARLITIGDHD